MAATNLNLSLANIMEGKITLDRAIKHLANRGGAAEPAVAIMEKKWNEIERERVRKVNTSRQ
ncbi:MAG: hypothetical protein ACRD72_09005 [Candidatus Angelobacter sp.]